MAYQHIYIAHLVNVAEVQVLPVRLILECMNEGWICGTKTFLCQQLILSGVLALEMEAEVDNGESHTGIACEVNTPGNVIPW